MSDVLKAEDRQEVIIILPTYNNIISLKLLIQTFFINTSYPSFRLMVVDGGSTDGTREYIADIRQRFLNIGYIFEEKKEGIPKAINKGINLANSGTQDFLIIQDDIVIPPIKPDWITRMVALAKDEQVGIVSCANGGGISGPDYLDGFPWIGTWCMYIPQRTIKKIGLFDEEFSPGAGDDIDYTYRIYKAGFKIGLSDFKIIHHRNNQASEYDKNHEMIKQHAEYFRKKHGLEVQR